VIDLISYVSMAGVVIGYALTDKYGKQTMDIANAVFFIPLMLTAFYHGAWAAGLLNLFFGLIAIKSLIKSK
jgi:thiamine transporter ThiT